MAAKWPQPASADLQRARRRPLVQSSSGLELFLPARVRRLTMSLVARVGRVVALTILALLSSCDIVPDSRKESGDFTLLGYSRHWGGHSNTRYELYYKRTLLADWV